MATAHVTLHPACTIKPVRRELFGGFVEHLGRHIYDGVHEPTHATSGPDGFRRDVVDLVKELGVTTIRFPGGNFVSGHRWEDTVGPVEDRPHSLDLAWHSTEPNRVGMDEFSQLLGLVRSEMMLATVETAKHGQASVIDAAATRSDKGVTSVFLVNRDLTDTTSITIDVNSSTAGDVRAHGIWDEDRFASNTLEQTDRLYLRRNESLRRDGSLVTVDLPPVSWTRVTVG